jgi:hypothetical protein
VTDASTTMWAPLLLGFLLGARHALDADHVAAVAALATGTSSAAERVKLAGAWGLGHAGTLLAFGVATIALGTAVPAPLVDALEGAVGVVLVLLGVGVLRRVRARRVHFHVHRHDDGTHHFHAHAHGTGDDRARHETAHGHGHEHRPPLPRALLVGTLHGLAGSAALVLLSLEVARSTAQAVAYLGLFGLGSVAGMCALSLAISLPLRLLPERLGATHRGLEGALGVFTIGLGSWIALGSALGR